MWSGLLPVVANNPLMSLTSAPCLPSNLSSLAVRALATVLHPTDEVDHASQLTAGREGEHGSNHTTEPFHCLDWPPTPLTLLFSSRASVSQGEGGIKNPRAKALWDKWRHVWMMAWERDRRLKDKLNYLQELEKVKNFNWEDWRKRYLKHHNNKKSRVQDFFRKLDDDGDGYCPRDEFIDGILKAKFPSSKLEMNAVADKFDHGDGMIDWREFMAALRPDWEERGPLTDTQRIDDEIKRQVAQCTCRQKFKVFQVGEGKYRVSVQCNMVISCQVSFLPP